MTDCHQNFNELAERERLGQDYQIRCVFRPSTALIMAPHGGGIEPGTSQIARMLAGDCCSWYVFEGVKTSGNWSLHLTSHHFDEPLALQLAALSDTILTVHGHSHARQEFVMVGGRHEGLRLDLQRDLDQAGFSVRFSEDGLRALHPLNICNRGKLRKGAQLELSRPLRRKLITEPQLMQNFLLAVRRVYDIS